MFCAQDLVLPLHSGISSGGAGGGGLSDELLRIKPQLVGHKTSFIPAVLSNSVQCELLSGIL